MGEEFSVDLNPQRHQMADESMVRTLQRQADAIWPQERELFARYGEVADVLDVGCGTGIVTAWIAQLFDNATVTGVDILLEHIARAESRASGKVRFQVGDAFALTFASDSADLVVCRHLLQSVPHPELVIAEMKRVCRPGGWLHLLAEDYGMIHFDGTTLDSDAFWRKGPIEFGKSMHTDLRIGKHAYSIFRDLGVQDIRVDYIVVDTVRVSREIIAEIWEAWRDGFTEAIAGTTMLERADVLAHWEDMIRCLRDPGTYAVWQVPVVSGRVEG